MKKKRSFILRGLVFLLLFSYLFVHISYAKRPDLSGVRDSVSGFYDEKKNTIDMVLIGASGCMSAFMPMKAYAEQGIAAYDFCLDDIACETVPYVINEAEKTQNPKLYVIDIRPFVTGATLKGYAENDEIKDVAYNTDAFRYSFDRLRQLYRYLPHKVSSLSYYFDLTRYHKEELNLKNWNSAYHNARRGFDFYPWGGSVTYDEETEERIAIDPYAEEQLYALLENCRKLDGKVVFFFLPYGHYDRCPELLQHRNYIADILEKENFDFLDLSAHKEEMGLTLEQDFCNDAHWNVYGAEKITAWLSRELQDRYGLPDRRGEAGYESWEADLESWTASVEEEKQTVDKQSANS
ncbi:MAG: hypothetical protein Q4B09_00610 [Lachnospiraceae bacterium]|nr:hypothetical protein [Lachnospiraceae bacterium]